MRVHADYADTPFTLRYLREIIRYDLLRSLLFVHADNADKYFTLGHLRET